MHCPQRTCIGCRGKGDKNELLRLVRSSGSASPDAVAVDLKQSEPGRGAYLHPDPDCLGLAVRRRALGRALKASQLDGRQLAQVVGPHLPRSSVTT
jgi:predicted RNA-binding protein YlxR (DUF448 family)